MDSRNTEIPVVEHWLINHLETRWIHTKEKTKGDHSFLHVRQSALPRVQICLTRIMHNKLEM